MKSLKIVILALLLLAVALFGASYQLPLQVEVEQSIVLAAKPEQVYPYIENPTLWEKWNAISTATDPSMIRLYSGPMTGTGARMQWNGDRVGKGEVVFLESLSPKQLNYKQTESKATGEINASIKLEPVDGGTRINWRLVSPVEDNPLARWLGVWQKFKKHEELEKGLYGLKTLLEDNTAKAVVSKRIANRD